MQICSAWWSWIEPIRECCSQTQSFLWLAVTMAGISTQTDLAGGEQYYAGAGTSLPFRSQHEFTRD